MEYGWQGLKTLEGHSGTVYSVAILGRDRIVSGGNTVKIWNTDGKCLKTLKTFDYGVFSAIFCPDRIVSGSEDNTAKMEYGWRVPKTLKGHSEWVCSVAILGPENR